MLVLSGIEKSFQGRPVLCGVDIAAEAGRCICVAGPNAQGKTTLLRIAAGELRPDAGRVEAPPRVGYSPQEDAPLGDLSVRDNLRLWYAAANRKEKPFAPGSAEEELGLAPVQSKRASRLSGGFRRRLALAAALAGKPALLILDEPFAPLDVHSQDDVVSLLLRFAAAGGGVLFSSHDPAVAARVADELHVLQEGRIASVLRLSRADSPEVRAQAVWNEFYKMQ